MLGFSTLASILRLGPREYLRQKIKLPLVRFIYDTINLYKSRTQTGINNVREVLFRGSVIALLTAVLVWLSIIMYVAFYYVYVPKISHERPVYLKFKPCGTTDDCISSKGICSFPSAHVQLTHRQQLLMSGQPYKIHLDLEMPESPTNRELGMFMVCVEFMTQNGKLVASSCRSTMLHYRGILLDTMYKLFYSPFFVLGSAEEKQNVHVELFSEFEEIENEPVTNIYVEIQTRHIEIYSAKFSVNAHLSGIRYVMFNWPIISAAFGITANLFFIALVCLISWYQIINSEEYLQFIEDNKTKTVISNNETDSVMLPELLEIFLDRGSMFLVPIIMGYDTVLYFRSKFTCFCCIPLKWLKYPVYSVLKEFQRIQIEDGIVKDENNEENRDNSNVNRIVCAKHKISGCKECLSTNSEISVSIENEDTFLTEEANVRHRKQIEDIEDLH